MKSSYLIVCFLAFLMLPVQIDGTDHRKSCVTKFINFFSEFFEDNQVGGYADAAMKQIIVKANSSKIVDAVINAAWNNLTTSQYSTGSTLLISGASKFGSYSAINETIQKCISGAAPVLLKLYPAAFKAIKIKKSTADKLAAGFAFADSKFKLPLCKKLVAKCKAKLDDDEWTKGSSMLKNYIKFSTLGYTVS